MHPFRLNAHIEVLVTFVRLDHFNASSYLILQSGKTAKITRAVQATGKATHTQPKQQFLLTRPSNPGMYPPPFYHAFHLDAMSGG